MLKNTLLFVKIF